ncbi:caffeoylshikimate esterase-like [Carex rostrata]
MAREIEKAEENESIKYDEEFITNSQGKKLFTCRWLPKNTEPKALVFVCHDTFTRLACAGYGVYGMDYIGHGKSSGLQGYIPNFNDLVGDCSAFFVSVCERAENRNKQRYLLGESMGGAVLLLLHRKQPTYWHGAVLVAPMCKIADEMKPPRFIIPILVGLANIIPTWKIVPINDVIDLAHKNPEKRQEIRNNPYCYKGKPRLKTAEQMLSVSLYLEKHLHEVSLPFLIVHGGDDKVTDPLVSKLLYESASSTDKKFNLYPGMWHALTFGEQPDNVDRVFHDIIAWLDERTASVNVQSEMEEKAKHDRIDLSSDMKLKSMSN